MVPGVRWSIANLRLAYYGFLFAAASVLFFVACGITLAVTQVACETAGSAVPDLLATTLLSALCTLITGLTIFVLDLKFLMPMRRLNHSVLHSPKGKDNSSITVALTCWNDEGAIADSVSDFLKHPLVKRVVVIDNNSSDGSVAAAKLAGAEVFVETRAGYGNCVYTALEKAAEMTDTNLVVLCEGDMTFRASDIDKLLAYAQHADLVNGTRIVEQLRSPTTQLTNFMYWGNFFAAKLLELKHLGRGTLTDLGTTYKLSTRQYLQSLLPHLDRNVNLEFNAHLLDKVLSTGGKLVEAPITFFPRVGESKGGNVSNRRAIRVGLSMIIGFTFGWKLISKANRVKVATDE